MPAVADGEVGASGTVAGVTEFEAFEEDPVPAAFVAVTVNVYAVPLVRPMTMAVVVAVAVVVEIFPGLEVIVYDVIAEPPFDAGAVYVTVA